MSRRRVWFKNTPANYTNKGDIPNWEGKRRTVIKKYLLSKMHGGFIGLLMETGGLLENG